MKLNTKKNICLSCPVDAQRAPENKSLLLSRLVSGNRRVLGKVTASFWVGCRSPVITFIYFQFGGYTNGQFTPPLFGPNQIYRCETSLRPQSGTNSQTLAWRKEAISLWVKQTHGTVQFQCENFLFFDTSEGRKNNVPKQNEPLQHIGRGEDQKLTLGLTTFSYFPRDDANIRCTCLYSCYLVSSFVHSDDCDI